MGSSQIQLLGRRISSFNWSHCVFIYITAVFAKSWGRYGETISVYGMDFIYFIIWILFLYLDDVELDTCGSSNFKSIVFIGLFLDMG